MPKKFVATVNVPGYLPMADEPAEFDTAQEAWSYLADERERGEDDTEGDEYSDTHKKLSELGEETRWQGRHKDVAPWLAENGLNADGEGTVYGDTPGYDGDHDLGLAYCVTLVVE